MTHGVGGSPRVDHRRRPGVAAMDASIGEHPQPGVELITQDHGEALLLGRGLDIGIWADDRGEHAGRLP